MLMMLLQTSPSLLEQLGGGATLIKKELERREQVEKMNVRYLPSLSLAGLRCWCSKRGFLNFSLVAQNLNARKHFSSLNGTFACPLHNHF